MDIVDTTARAQFTAALERVIRGELSSLDCMALDPFFTSRDRAVSQVWEMLDEILWNDLYPNMKITLNPECLSRVQRCVLFLRSGRKYRWPDYPQPKSCIIFAGMFIVTFLLWFFFWTIGVAGNTRWMIFIAMPFNYYWIMRWRDRRDFQKWSQAGDRDFWPFVTRNEYHEAQKDQPDFPEGG